MLMIRLARVGKKKQPYYRLVVSEKARDLYGPALEIIGTYNPRSKEAQLQEERITHWLKQGAQASATVHNLLVTHGIIKDKKVAVTTINAKKRKKMEDKNAKKAEAQASSESKADTTQSETQEKQTKDAPETPVAETTPAEETPTEVPEKETTA